MSWLKRLSLYASISLLSSVSQAGPSDWFTFSKTLMIAARHSWLEDYKEEKLVKRISEIASGDLHAIDSEKLDKLVKSRIKAQALRAVYRFLDESHSAPIDFNNFVMDFGDFKDSRESRVEREELADKLLKTITSVSPIESTEAFVPCTQSSFYAYVEKRVLEISVLAKEDELAKKAYHELRIGFRDFLMFFELYQTYQRDPRLEPILDRLQDVSRKMGRKHDDIVTDEMETERRNTDLIKVPKIAFKAAKELETVTKKVFSDLPKDSSRVIGFPVMMKRSGLKSCAARGSRS